MAESDSTNNFKFTLTQGSVVLYNRIFDGNEFSLHTRSYVDIRKILPTSINQLQKVLSKNSYNTIITVDGDGKLVKGSYYNMYAEHIKDLNSFPLNYRRELEYNPEPISFKVNTASSKNSETMTIKGVECKIVLFKNDTPIVERLFYVDRFNPVARWSVDLLNVCEYIVDDIYDIIKKSDVMYLWSEYDKLQEPSDILVID